jgi:hypothetical protein
VLFELSPDELAPLDEGVLEEEPESDVDVVVVVDALVEPLSDPEEEPDEEPELLDPRLSVL